MVMNGNQEDPPIRARGGPFLGNTRRGWGQCVFLNRIGENFEDLLALAVNLGSPPSFPK